MKLIIALATLAGIDQHGMYGVRPDHHGHPGTYAHLCPNRTANAPVGVRPHLHASPHGNFRPDPYAPAHGDGAATDARAGDCPRN